MASSSNYNAENHDFQDSNMSGESDDELQSNISDESNSSASEQSCIEHIVVSETIDFETRESRDKYIRKHISLLNIRIKSMESHIDMLHNMVKDGRQLFDSKERSLKKQLSQMYRKREKLSVHLRSSVSK